MGLLDGLAGQLLSSLGPGSRRHANLLPHVLEMLQGQGGGQGINGLLDAFNSKLKGKLF